MFNCLAKCKCFPSLLVFSYNHANLLPASLSISIRFSELVLEVLNFTQGNTVNIFYVSFCVYQYEGFSVLLG